MNDDPGIKSEKIVDDLGKQFELVGRRHLHPFWVWGLLGISVAFAGTLIYVSNVQGQFNQSLAESIEIAPRQVAAELPPLGEVIKFASGDGDERVGVYVPHYGRIEDAPTGIPVIAGIVSFVFLGPALAWLGEVTGVGGTVAEGIAGVDATLSAIVGTESLFANPVLVGATRILSAVHSVVGWIDASRVANLQAVTASTGSGIATGVGLGAAKRATRTPTVWNPEVSIADVAAKATRQINKEVALINKLLDRKVCGVQTFTLLQETDDGRVSVDPKSSVATIQKEAIKQITAMKTIPNKIRAAYTINLVYLIAVNGLRDVTAELFKNGVEKQKCAYRDQEILVTKRDKMAGARAIQRAFTTAAGLRQVGANRSQAVAGTEAWVHYRDDDAYVEYERSRMIPATVLASSAEQPWEATLPDSAWIGFRASQNKNGGGPVQNTIMVSQEVLDLSAIPVEAYLAVLGTNKQIEVRVNGITVYSVPAHKRGLVIPTEPTILDIAPYLGIGKNRVAVYIVQSTGAKQRFGLNYAGFINLPLAASSEQPAPN